MWVIVERMNIETGSGIFTKKKKHHIRRLRDESIILDCVQLYGALICVDRVV
jgi:hypothetical protein